MSQIFCELSRSYLFLPSLLNPPYRFTTGWLEQNLLVFQPEIYSQLGLGSNIWIIENKMKMSEFSIFYLFFFRLLVSFECATISWSSPKTDKDIVFGCYISSPSMNTMGNNIKNKSKKFHLTSYNITKQCQKQMYTNCTLYYVIILAYIILPWSHR